MQVHLFIMDLHLLLHFVKACLFKLKLYLFQLQVKITFLNLLLIHVLVVDSVGTVRIRSLVGVDDSQLPLRNTEVVVISLSHIQA